jgi:hypothetical protein
MMTRLKRWLQKLFSWWRWREEPEAPALPASTSSERVKYWKEPGPQMHPYSPVAGEHRDDEFSFSSPPSSLETGRENTTTPTGGEKAVPSIPLSPAPLPPPASVPAPVPAPSSPAANARSESESAPEVEHHLVFLRYLVRKGIVNEGFPEDQPPQRYP